MSRYDICKANELSVSGPIFRKKRHKFFRRFVFAASVINAVLIAVLVTILEMSLISELLTVIAIF